MNKWEKWSIEILESEDFPNQLKVINKPPKRLYYRGNFDINLFDKTIAVVGSRRMTRYGKEVLRKILPEYISSGFTVISGFMYGVDSEAHRLTIEMGGKTVAILGMGLNKLSLKENDALYTDILVSGGLVMSEYEPDTLWARWTFPSRNRIVSGLSTEGIVVVEAGLNSGSLITARLGIEQGKSVYAVPGPITSSVSAGTNWLISENKAKMITGTVTSVKSANAQQGNLFELTTSENKIVAATSSEYLTVDEISIITGIPANKIGAILSSLCLRNYIYEEGGKYSSSPA